MWREGRLHGNLFSDEPKLGLGVTSDLLDNIEPAFEGVEADKNLNATYVLSGNQRQLLNTGDVGNRYNRNEGVLQKRDKVPERFHDLITDLSLMHVGSILSEGKWEKGVVDNSAEGQRKTYARQLEEMDPGDLGADSSKVEDFPPVDESDDDSAEDSNSEDAPRFQSQRELWEAVIDSPAHAHHANQDAIFHGTHAVSKEAQLGFEIASILRFLRPDDRTATFESRWGMEEVPGGALIWGFLIGMIGAGRNNLDEEEERFETLIDAVGELQEVRRNDIDKLPTMDEVNRAQFREGVVEAVEASNISAHPIILREVEYHVPNRGKAGEESDLGWTMEDDVESADALDDEYVEKYAKKTLHDIIDATPLAEVDHLRTRVEADLEVIRERSKPGVDSAREILLDVWRCYRVKGAEAEEETSEDTDGGDDGQEELSTVEMLKRRIRTNGAFAPKRFGSRDFASFSNSKEGKITAVLHCISDVEGYEQWTAWPLVRKANNSSSWGLTDYGALLCYVILEYEEETDWLYRYAIGPEELSLLERHLVGNVLGETGYIQ